MVSIDYDEATKKIALKPESLASLSERDQQDAVATTSLVNDLMASLVAHNGEVPPVNTLTKSFSVGASKIANNGIKSLMQNKPDEAIKLLSTALEMVLRRPLWEPTVPVLEEVCACLMPRCDAYIASKRWADAYADASLLMLLKPNDPTCQFRKGIVLSSAGRKTEAREYLMTACRTAPNNNTFKAALKSLE